MSSIYSRVFLCVLAVVLGMSPAFSQTLTIEAEDYTAAYNQGGLAIQSLPGSGCSGGYLLVGLDYSGEWVEFDVPISDYGYYPLVLKTRGDLGLSYSLRLILTAPDETEQSIDFTFTGNGYG